MKVLIIEDHPRIRENIVAFFQMQLHTADSAKNGEEGLQKALVNKYDILLLDMAMPIMSGQCFLEELRKQNNMTPVLVMTSNSLLEDKEIMYTLGADDFIVKPFELKELLMRSIAINRRQ